MNEFIQIGASKLAFTEVDAYLGEWKKLRTNPIYQQGLKSASRVFIRGGRLRLRQRLLNHGKTTGNLLSSFSFRLKKEKPDAIVGFGRYGRHSHLVDRGTVKRYHKSGKYVGIMPANYFWKETFERDSPTAMEEFKKGIINALFR